jgi:hypothetical protein
VPFKTVLISRAWRGVIERSGRNLWMVPAKPRNCPYSFQSCGRSLLSRKSRAGVSGGRPLKRARTMSGAR